MADDADDILFEERGAAGIVTLNRPRQLHALTETMVRRLAAMLERWRDAAGVARVVIRATGTRAFCAGGDIRSIHGLLVAGRQVEALAFWREEYRLNAAIKRYPKPIVALVDGLVMGGGVGVSFHAAERLGGPALAFAMPEVAIGFFPDVGATHLLSRLPGGVGPYLALTGARVGQGDALALGLLSGAVGDVAHPDLMEALTRPGDIVELVAPFLAAVPPGPLADPAGPTRRLIDHAFAAEDVEGVMERLAAAEGSLAAETLAVLRSRSPTSLRVALEQMRRGRTLSFEAALELEFRIVSRMVHNPDFAEGIRAAIIDKDQAPRWQPATLAAVGPAAIEAYFAPVPEPLGLPEGSD